MARVELALPLAGLLLAACAPAVGKDVPTAPISPASVPASGPGKCNPIEFAAALGVPTPAPKDVSLPPNIAEINARVANCDYSITDPEKAVYRRVMPLITRDLQTPAPARPEQQRVVPGAGGGAPPPDLLPPTFTPVPPLPSATPTPPELAATIPITLTLPDGTKATVIIPPPTATPEREHWPTDPRIGMPEDLRRIQPEPTLPPKPRQSLSDQAPQKLKELYKDADKIAKYYQATGYDPNFVSEQFRRSLKNNLARCDDPSIYNSSPNSMNYFGCLQNVWSQLGAPNNMYENPPALDFAKQFIAFVKATLGSGFKPEQWLIGDGKTYKLN